MIAHDSWWSNERARFNYHRLSSTIIDYHAPFDQGLKTEYFAASIDSVHLVEVEIVLFCIWSNATNSRSPVRAKTNTIS